MRCLMQFKIKKVKKKQTGNKVIKLIYNRLEGLEKKKCKCQKEHWHSVFTAN